MRKKRNMKDTLVSFIRNSVRCLLFFSISPFLYMSFHYSTVSQSSFSFTRPVPFPNLQRGFFFLLSLPCLQAEVKLQMRKIDDTERKKAKFSYLIVHTFFSFFQRDEQIWKTVQERKVHSYEEPNEDVWARKRTVELNKQKKIRRSLKVDAEKKALKRTRSSSTCEPL